MTSPKILPENNAPYVDVCSLWVTYGSTVAVRDVCLTIDGPGEVLGIIGPNGGGKTTFLKCLLGLVKPHRGSVSIFGLPPEKARKYVGYVPQVSRIDLDFPISVIDVVLMGRLGHTGLFGRYSQKDREIAENALRIVGMADLKDRQIGGLSGGQRQRVFIARALANEPRLLLMDEPSTGLDPAMQEELYALLDTLKKDMAVILISHDLSAVSLHVDKIACLRGTIHFHDPAELSRAEFISAYACPVDRLTHTVGSHPETSDNHLHDPRAVAEDAHHCAVCDDASHTHFDAEPSSGKKDDVSESAVSEDDESKEA